jgi:hypothetical protein
MRKFEQGWVIREEAGVCAHVRQKACFVGGALKKGDLEWLPSIDAIRTFCLTPTAEALQAIEAPKSKQD